MPLGVQVRWTQWKINLITYTLAEGKFILGSSLQLKRHNSYPIKYIYSESIGRKKGFLWRPFLILEITQIIRIFLKSAPLYTTNIGNKTLSGYKTFGMWKLAFLFWFLHINNSVIIGRGNSGIKNGTNTVEMVEWKNYPVHRSFFEKALLISWIYILIEFKLCSNATRSTNTGWVLQHTFHSRTLYIPFSFILLCFVYSFALIQFARTCESVRKRQQTTLAIRDALIAIALLSFHANFPNMFAMRMRGPGNEEEEGGGRGVSGYLQFFCCSVSRSTV